MLRCRTAAGVLLLAAMLLGAGCGGGSSNSNSLTEAQTQLCTSSAHAVCLLSQVGALLEPAVSLAGGASLGSLDPDTLEAAYRDALHAADGIEASALAGGGVEVLLEGLLLAPTGLRVDGTLTLRAGAGAGSSLVGFGPLQIADGILSGEASLAPAAGGLLATTTEPLLAEWQTPRRDVQVALTDLVWSFGGGGVRTLSGGLSIEPVDLVHAAAPTAVTAASVVQDSLSAFPQSGTLSVPLESFTPEIVFDGTSQAELDLSTGTTVALTLPAVARRHTLGRHEGATTAVAASPDQTALVSGGADGFLRMWAADRSGLEARIAAHTGGVSACVWGAAGIVSAGADNVLRVWDPTSTTQLGQLALGASCAALAVSPGSEPLIAGALGDGSVRLWSLEDPAAPAVVTTYAGHTGGTRAVAFSSDGTRLASAGADDTARLWSLAVEGGAPLALTGHTADVTGVGFLPDGTLVTTSLDATVRMWNPTTGAPVGAAGAAPTKWSATGYGCLVVCADGVVATGGTGYTGVVWWTRSGAKITTTTQCAVCSGDVTDLAVTTDGRGTLIASTDGSAKLVTTGLHYQP